MLAISQNDGYSAENFGADSCFDESGIKPPAILHRNYNDLHAVGHRGLRLAN